MCLCFEGSAFFWKRVEDCVTTETGHSESDGPGRRILGSRPRSVRTIGRSSGRSFVRAGPVRLEMNGQYRGTDGEESDQPKGSGKNMSVLIASRYLGVGNLLGARGSEDTFPAEVRTNCGHCPVKSVVGTERYNPLVESGRHGRPEQRVFLIQVRGEIRSRSGRSVRLDMR